MILVSSEAIPSLPLSSWETHFECTDAEKNLAGTPRSGHVDGSAHHGAVQASPAGMLSLAVLHMDRTSFECWSTLTYYEALATRRRCGVLRTTLALQPAVPRTLVVSPSPVLSSPLSSKSWRGRICAPSKSRTSLRSTCRRSASALAPCFT